MPAGVPSKSSVLNDCRPRIKLNTDTARIIGAKTGSVMRQSIVVRIGAGDPRRFFQRRAQPAKHRHQQHHLEPNAAGGSVHPDDAPKAIGIEQRAVDKRQAGARAY